MKSAVTRSQTPYSAGREAKAESPGNRFFPGRGGMESRSLVAHAGLAQALDVVIAIGLLLEGINLRHLFDTEIGIQLR